MNLGEAWGRGRVPGRGIASQIQNLGSTGVRGSLAGKPGDPKSLWLRMCSVLWGASIASLNSQENPLHTSLRPPSRSRTMAPGCLHTSPCWVTTPHCPQVGRQATLASPWEGESSPAVLRALLPPPINTCRVQPSSARGPVQGQGGVGRGIRRDSPGSLMGRRVSHQSPSLRAHQIFMAIKRSNFLPRVGPRAQSTAGQTRRGSRGTAPAGSLKSSSCRRLQAGGQPPGSGEQRWGPLAASSPRHTHRGGALGLLADVFLR